MGMTARPITTCFAVCFLGAIAACDHRSLPPKGGQMDAAVDQQGDAAAPPEVGIELGIEQPDAISVADARIDAAGSDASRDTDASPAVGCVDFPSGIFPAKGGHCSVVGSDSTMCFQDPTPGEVTDVVGCALGSRVDLNSTCYGSICCRRIRPIYQSDRICARLHPRRRRQLSQGV
jgi:hypothetical protein